MVSILFFCPSCTKEATGLLDPMAIMFSGSATVTCQECSNVFKASVEAVIYGDTVKVGAKVDDDSTE